MTFAAFYEMYASKVVSYLRFKGLSDSDAEELSSQVFLYCYQHFDNYDPDKASYFSWLFLIVRSRLKNFWRSKRQMVDLEEMADVLPDEKSDVERAVILDELRERVASVLEQMPDRARRIVILRYFQNMSAQEIALKLGMTTGAVRTQLSRALDRMQQYFDDLY